MSGAASTNLDIRNLPIGISEGDITTSDNVRLHYWFYNRNSETVTIFLHGSVSGSSKIIDTGFADKYADKIGSLLIFDRRGQGKSQADLAPEQFKADRLSSDINELKEALIPDHPVIIMGRSFGGFIAALYANSSPTNVKGYILVDPGYFDLATVLEGAEKMDHEKIALIVQMEQAYFSKLHDNNLYDQGSNQNQGPITETLDSEAESDFVKPLKIETEDQTYLLDALKDDRVLFIHGEFDPQFPPDTINEIRPILPDAQIAKIKDAGHSAQYTHQDEFIEIVGDFLATF